MHYFEPKTRRRPDFPAGSREYEPAIAWWLAECSRLAYDSKRRVAVELERADFEKVTFFDNGGAEGYLAVHRGTGGFGPFAVLAFRGTEDNFRDILTDVNFFKRKSTAGNVRVHGGFLDALTLIWGSAALFETRGRRIDIDWKGAPGVSNALDEMRCEFGVPGLEIPIYYTGHSLGAALATLAANNYPPTAMYTFGSPRVGGKDLVQYFRRSGVAAFRVVHSTDIVPHVPLPPAFRHVGRVVYITRRDNVRLGVSSHIRCLELLREICWLAWLPFPRALSRSFEPRILSNHRISGYVKALEKNLKNAETELRVTGGVAKAEALEADDSPRRRAA